jgi:hypothetical protein
MHSCFKLKTDSYSSGLAIFFQPHQDSSDSALASGSGPVGV